jgi:hypothetical protein
VKTTKSNSAISFAPAGLGFGFIRREPSDKSLGYFQLSLRDMNKSKGQIYCRI